MKKQRILTFILAALFVFAFGCAAMLAKDEVVEIGSAEDLVAFRDRVNKGETTLNAKLMADIDLGGANWEPIGKFILSGRDYSVLAGNSYDGVFDGNGKTIKGLKLTPDDAVPFVFSLGGDIYVGGLFGVLSRIAEVRNLNIENPDISVYEMSAGPSAAGAIAGFSEGKIENCGVQGGTLLAYSQAGGIVGRNHGTVTNCTANGIKCTAGFYAGGVAGYNDDKGSITNCTASGAMTIKASALNSSSFAGGVVGENKGTITNCTANGAMTITAVTGYLNSFAGGVAGYNGDKGTITNCTARDIVRIEGMQVGGVAGRNYGEVTNCTASGAMKIMASARDESPTYTGGVVGNNNGKIMNCTASGAMEIIATSPRHGSYAGGVVGNNHSEVMNCAASGAMKITASYVFTIFSSAGGIVGHNDLDSTITNCTASGIQSIASYAAGGVAGYNNGGTIKNCRLLAGKTPTMLSGAPYAGGVLGCLEDGVSNLNQVQNCHYPPNVKFSKNVDRPIGNIELEDMNETYKVASYDVNADVNALPAIVALLEQGVSIVLEKGRTCTLDITMLPGTDGIESMIFAWATEDDSIVTVSGNGTAVTLTGVELGTTNVTCTITGSLEAKLTCAVTVIVPDSLGESRTMK